jgi:O-methyltransferase
MVQRRIEKWMGREEKAVEPPPYDNAYVDEANQDHVSGWALFHDGVESIDILVDGTKVAEAEYEMLRVDVEALLPDVPGSRHSGFCHLFQPGDFARSSGPVAAVQVVFRSKGELSIPSDIVQIPTAHFTTRYSDPSEDRVVGLPPSPFPREVHRALVELRGEAVYGLDTWTHDAMQEAVTDLFFLHQRASKESAGLFSYFAFLMEMWGRLEFNARNFPKLNRISTEDRKDRYGVATAPEELFVISHHLANLKSRGVKGSLCEFGCFKGFSTSGLSHACARLGLRMDVFDSFEGLPASDSNLYREGEFKGSFHEVTRNVAEFGHLPSVSFHRGFFADSVPHYPEREIACIWMDVDLEVSARDALRLFPRLAPESCLFSDEIGPDNFSEGRVVGEPPSPDSVLPPIIDAFAADGRSIVGNFVWGHTGVFRDEKRGIPVIETASLLRLKDALLAR